MHYKIPATPTATPTKNVILSVQDKIWCIKDICTIHTCMHQDQDTFIDMFIENYIQLTMRQVNQTFQVPVCGINISFWKIFK